MCSPSHHFRKLSIDMTVPPSSPSSSSHDSSPPSLRPVSEVSMEELPDFDSEATGRQSPQEYRVQHCVAFSDQPPAYYAFRIVPQETCLGVRIGAPGSRYDPPTCSCDVFRDTPHGCPHVEWLSRQLADVASRSPYHADTIKSHSAFSVLDSIGLPQVAEHLEWPVREQPSTAADRVFSVEEQVRDMLSTFAADGRLPEDDLARAQATMQDDTAPKEELRSCKTLESFIFRLALKDDEVFRALRDALNPDHCASIYLDKLDTRATALLGGEDPSTKARAHGTEETADSLRHIADKIRASLELRAPVSPGVKSQACQILVRMLRRISEQASSSAPSLHLLHELVGRDSSNDLPPSVSRTGPSPSPSPSPTHIPNHARDFPMGVKGRFVLETLWMLLPAARAYVEELEDVRARLEVSAGVSAGYVAELARFIALVRDRGPSVGARVGGEIDVELKEKAMAMTRAVSMNRGDEREEEKERGNEGTTTTRRARAGKERQRKERTKARSSGGRKRKQGQTSGMA